MKKENFENIKCEHLFDTDPIETNGVTYTKGCKIASEIAGFHCPANAKSCEFCLKSDNPKNNNLATRGLGTYRKHELWIEGLPQDHELKKFKT